ncbi:MAG TPA: phospholipid carrier-dependent glycosyltransferase [Anaerolineae bacterium]|nr:phospholipid carrier-dependent glycosyltransferase [Anaerolineae bacterium]HQK14701.1 phospholipid carrier-dependent glycosyltransferase [Anaerolineae bacterium]
MNMRLRFGAILLLWLLFAILVSGARQLSMTSDEPAHIAVGYSLLAEGTKAFWIFPQHGHPPLLNILEAALFYWANPAIPLTGLDGWAQESVRYYFASFAAYLTPIEQVEMTARLPIIFLTILLGALIFRWGCELWHPLAGLLALLVLCFDPLLLAHGRLATTDVGTVALGTAALYLAWRWQRRPGWKLAWGVGLLLGLTMLAKSSGVIWAASVAGIVLFTIVWRYREGRTLQLLCHGFVMGGLGIFIIWAAYGFTWGVLSEEISFSVPAPAHWRAFLGTLNSVAGRWVFALEERILGRWWWYFPVAFLIKNPLPLLIGLGLGGVVLLQKPIDVRRLVTLGIFPLLYAILSVTGGMNIGYRHILPIHPFFYLVIGGGLWHWLRQTSWRRWVMGGLGLWYVAGTLRLFPYEIAFFNELIGGPENGHHYLIDSNIDWGQGYKALQRYLAEHPGPTPQIAYNFAFLSPRLYDIDAIILPPQQEVPSLKSPFHPPAGRYIISITTLQAGWLESPDMYAWFREIAPTANLGYAFFLYDIDPLPLQWFSQCTTPVPPLTGELIAKGVGNVAVRRVDFDCTTGWLYPDGGTTPGIYAVHRYLVPQKAHTLPTLLPSPPHAEDAFLARRLADQRLSFNMRRFTAEFPAFSLYEPQQSPTVPTNEKVYLMRGATLPDVATPVAASPIAFQGPLAFVGTLAYPDANGLTVETWWRVTAETTGRSFSIMAHLLDGQGTPLGVADGLSIAPHALVPGDLFVQRHQFAGVDIAQLWLRTGVYWADDLTRWPTIAVPDADMLLIQLK